MVWWAIIDNNRQLIFLDVKIRWLDISQYVNLDHKTLTFKISLVSEKGSLSIF